MDQPAETDTRLGCDFGGAGVCGEHYGQACGRHATLGAMPSMRA